MPGNTNPLSAPDDLNHYSFFRYNTNALIWALLILVLSAIPGSSLPSVSLGKFPADKVGHFFFYAILILLMLVGQYKQFRFSLKRNLIVRRCMVLAISYGILLEILQGYVFRGREIDALDALANTLGCFSGLAFFYLVYGKKNLND